MDVSRFGSLSPNGVEDRRDEGLLAKLQAYAQFPSLDTLKEMLQHPLTMPEAAPVAARYPQQPLGPINPLGVQAGMLQIGPVARQLAADRAAAEKAKVNADPDIHSFDEPVDPNGPPIALDRRKDY